MTIFVYKGLKDWPEFPKSEIPPSEFCPISGDLGELGIPNLTRMSLIKCYWILQNARVKASTVYELLRETQQGGVVKLTPPPRLGLKPYSKKENIQMMFLNIKWHYYP